MKLQYLIVFLAVLLVGLLILVPFIGNEDPSDPTGTSVTSSLFTEPESTTTTNPTQPSSQPSTQTPTQPSTQPDVPYSDNAKMNAFVAQRMKTWTCPVKDAFGEVTGSRKFATSRGGGKRAHAGLDFVAPHGTKVYAITSGTVQRVAVFYQNTWAVEVLNDDGSVLRYCEIATSLKVGDYLQQGDVVGTIMRADSGTEMLHMEVYFGDGAGALTQKENKTYTYLSERKNFLRRSDLLDPTFLKDLPKG